MYYGPDWELGVGKASRRVRRKRGSAARQFGHGSSKHAPWCSLAGQMVTLAARCVYEHQGTRGDMLPSASKGAKRSGTITCCGRERVDSWFVVGIAPVSSGTTNFLEMTAVLV